MRLVIILINEKGHNTHTYYLTKGFKVLTFFFYKTCENVKSANQRFSSMLSTKKEKKYDWKKILLYFEQVFLLLR